MTITFASAAKRMTFTFTHRIVRTSDLALINPTVALEWDSDESGSTHTLWFGWLKRQLALTISIKHEVL